MSIKNDVDYSVPNEAALKGTWKGVRFRITASADNKRYVVRIGKWSAEHKLKRDIWSAIKDHVRENY